MKANKKALSAETISTVKEKYIQNLLSYIKQSTDLNEEETAGIVESINMKTFQKGEFLVKEGQISTMCYFILKGCVREYHLKNGEEITTNFYTEEQAISSLTGNPRRQPSAYYLEAIEETILTCSTPEQESQMLKAFPRFEHLCRIKLEEMMEESQTKMSDYITSTPTERYLRLLKNSPELVNRVPQYQLASFIGVKPESLSRIRKKIAQGK